MPYKEMCKPHSVKIQMQTQIRFVRLIFNRENSIHGPRVKTSVCNATLEIKYTFSHDNAQPK